MRRLQFKNGTCSYITWFVALFYLSVRSSFLSATYILVCIKWPRMKREETHISSYINQWFSHPAILPSLLRMIMRQIVSDTQWDKDLLFKSLRQSMWAYLMQSSWDSRWSPITIPYSICISIHYHHLLTQKVHMNEGSGQVYGLFEQLISAVRTTSSRVSMLYTVRWYL